MVSIADESFSNDCFSCPCGQEETAPSARFVAAPVASPRALLPTRQPTTPIELQERLELLTGKSLELKLNANRYSVLYKRPIGRNRVRLSIHQRFLDAPTEVTEAIAAWVTGTEEVRQDKLLRSFINQHFPTTPAEPVDPASLDTKGQVYDLCEIFGRLNGLYFDHKLDLHITWFSPRSKRARRQVTLGQYFDELRLVKINRLLDNPRYPYQFISFVVFHEMVHHVVPPIYDSVGRKIVHSPQFRARERDFEDYDYWTEWEKRYFTLC